MLPSAWMRVSCCVALVLRAWSHPCSSVSDWFNCYLQVVIRVPCNRKENFTLYLKLRQNDDRDTWLAALLRGQACTIARCIRGGVEWHLCFDRGILVSSCQNENAVSIAIRIHNVRLKSQYSGLHFPHESNVELCTPRILNSRLEAKTIRWAAVRAKRVLRIDVCYMDGRILAISGVHLCSTAGFDKQVSITIRGPNLDLKFDGLCQLYCRKKSVFDLSADFRLCPVTSIKCSALSTLAPVWVHILV